MAYSIEWYIENEIIYIHYSGVVTADDMRDTIVIGNDLIEKSSRPLVHAIIDVGDITEPVSPKESLLIAREVGMHPRTGWTILLRERSVIIRIGVMFGTSLFKARSRAFGTIKQAESFLKEADPTLSWNRVNRSVVANQS
jgi:hypothetical protein